MTSVSLMLVVSCSGWVFVGRVSCCLFFLIVWFSFVLGFLVVIVR